MEIRHVVNEGFFIFGENGDELAKLTYRKEGEKLYFESTVVSSELRGQGLQENYSMLVWNMQEKMGIKLCQFAAILWKSLKVESTKEFLQRKEWSKLNEKFFYIFGF